MIHAVLIFNNQGKPRLSKFYNNPSPSNHRSNLTRSIYELILNRSTTNSYSNNNNNQNRNHGFSSNEEEDGSNKIYNRSSCNLISIDPDKLNWFFYKKKSNREISNLNKTNNINNNKNINDYGYGIKNFKGEEEESKVNFNKTDDDRLKNRTDNLNNVNIIKSNSSIRSKKFLNVVYRNYATLYFAFVIDSVESELAILDLIQVKKKK